eukprot:UN25230
MNVYNTQYFLQPFAFLLHHKNSFFDILNISFWKPYFSSIANQQRFKKYIMFIPIAFFYEGFFELTYTCSLFRFTLTLFFVFAFTFPRYQLAYPEMSF